ncbi:MAG: conjugal transfer protein TraG N-terminal domain-containing protein, partial [Alphaproteobacteria bacterium]|nr:conjugal transfer protein TraG N-terminal domain-containing protein [Alphaproteobacteria bacterium]
MTHWIMPLFLILVLFFVPTCRVHIYDPVTGYRFPVDHVPWGLGAVAGAISKIGDRMTKEVETVFSLPDDFKYHKTGAVMASNLIANARTFHITNSDLAETLQSFVTQCVVYDALLGKKYTLDDLKTSPNIWDLVIQKLSPARSFTFKAPGKGQKSRIVPCIQAVPLLNQWLKQDMQTAFQLFESIVFGKKEAKNAPNLASLGSGAHLKQYLPGAFHYMTQMAKSAEDVMMQQMMIYSVVDSIENTSTSLGNAPNFAIRRAYLHQRANQETLAGVAAQKLIAMKNVLEALIYAGFIFILPLALLPMGWSFISRWIGLVMWIQLWPPLYAILNFIMNVSVRSKGIGMISGPQGSGITIANSVGFMNLHADMAAQAGFMSIAVGSIAYALVKGGAASFVHLASHLGGPAAAAASRATEDLMSGNYSFGNVNQGNIQAYNTSFGQQNLSPSYSSGAFTQNDGVISRTTGSDGSHMVTVSSSNLRSSLNFSESLSNSYTEQASKAKQTAETQLVAASQAEADHNRQVMDFSEHKAKQVSGSESYSTGDTATTNQAFSKLDGLVDRFAKDHSVSKEVAAQIMAKAAASTSVGFGFKFFENGATANFTGEIGGGVSGSASDRDLFSAAKDYSQQSNFQETLNQASQAARDSRYADLNDKGQRAASSINDSYEKSHQYREEASASLQQSESFSQMASWTKQNAGSINANLNQEYVNWLQDQSLPNSSGPMGIREAETIFTSRPELDSHYQQRFMEDKMQQADQFVGSHGLASKSSDIDRTYDQSKSRIANPVNQEITQGTAASQASAHGLGNDFEVNTGPRDEAQKMLSSTGK